jgi:hypothetical protein
VTWSTRLYCKVPGFFHFIGLSHSRIDCLGDRIIVTADINALRDTLIDEAIRAVGLPTTPWLHRAVARLFHGPIEQFSSGGVTFDQMVEHEGFQKAAAWVLTQLCSNVTAYGSENVPPKGALLVIANHPGTVDVLVIAAMLNRNDVKIITSDIVFLKCLPNTFAHLIGRGRTYDIYKRMAAIRAGIRHLQSGGTLILLGTGVIDPDPETDPQAEKDLELWSPSIDLFLRKVPEANVLVTIVSGVLSRGWGYHPITWLRHDGWRKRLLAEFGQVIQQLLFPGSLHLTPQVSFAPAVSTTELQAENSSGRVLPAIIKRAKTLMVQHLDRISSDQEQRTEISELAT